MKLKKNYMSFMIAAAILILIGFGLHAYRTNIFNNKEFVIREDSAESEHTFDFTPQNGKKISWTRTANIGDEKVDLYACSYDGTFTNYDSIKVSDWTMRLDINDDCYLNAAWCGLVEIHQNEDGAEKVQILDLRNFDHSEVKLTSYEDGDITLFPLTKGDYLIYYPDVKAKEMPIVATEGEPGRISIGIIFYWNQNNDFIEPDFTVNYQLHRDFMQGSEATMCIAAAILWLLALIVIIAVTITGNNIKKKAEIELSKKDVEKKTAEKMLDEMIRTLANTIDAKDGYTHGHSERVAQYSLKLAQSMNLSSNDCKEIFYAGLVHDVGKIAVPREIINKPGRLTDEEFDVIKTHPGRGEKILSQISDMPYLSVGAKYHHEKYDGFGYPDHVKGEDIPLLARIIAVADAYDAMTSKRSYRDTLNQKIVKQEIWKGIGTQFDPLIAKHMIALIDADVDYDMREKTDEVYETIDEIKKNEFWEKYNPKSIKVEDKVLSDTNLKYFGEFVSAVDHWMNPIELCKVTEEELKVSFISRTDSASEYIWETPALIIYSSEGGKLCDPSYEELAVLMSAGYSWRVGSALYEENSLTREDGFINWNNWLDKNKEGLEYIVTVKRDKDNIIINIENGLLTVKWNVTLPGNYTKDMYVCATGENCIISK